MDTISRTSVADQTAPISRDIWNDKYRLKQFDGTPVDATIEDTWRRVARALAAAESDSEGWQHRFYEALSGFKFLPAGRIIAGAGTGRRVTLFNCFVMGTIPDDMSGIFSALREAALTMQQGGGIGYDFSTLRPKGAPVKGVGADASGPLSFMDVWDAMCRTIMSAGHRRGAMMATLRCEHPDIEAFIEAKHEPGRLRMFNLSVLVTDAFMAAVKADAPWELIFAGMTYKVLPARELWDKIMRSTYAYAEPGVIFIDRINRRNNLWYCETIAATNPCGEEPLPPYGACLLGSINLAALVRDPFTPEARLDMDELERLVPTAVRMLDNAIEVSRFPLEEQAHEARAKRRVGLGVTGLADALIFCGVRYGSDAAVSLTTQWMKAIQRQAYLASTALAAEKGAFPLFDREQYLAGETVAALHQDVRAAIAARGIRNALLTAVAPTGTISLFADNVSSGIEPVFALAYGRQILNPDGTKRREQVEDHAICLYRRLRGQDALLTDQFVTAQDLTPADHVRMQAAVQAHVDSAISKTVNCPADISFESFERIYLDAFESGCKGCATHRPNEVTGSILEAASMAQSAAPSPAPAAADEPIDRPEDIPGSTYKLRWPDSEHALYITINDIEVDGRRRPFEIFINSKNMEHYAWVVALTRMISGIFRHRGEVAFVVEELKAVFDPRGGAWHKGRYVPSLIAAIGGIVEQHLIKIGFIAAPEATDPLTHTDHLPLRLGPLCPKCGQPGLVKEGGGCFACRHCGWSKCT